MAAVSYLLLIELDNAIHKNYYYYFVGFVMNDWNWQINLIVSIFFLLRYFFGGHHGGIYLVQWYLL